MRSHLVTVLLLLSGLGSTGGAFNVNSHQHHEPQKISYLPFLNFSSPAPYIFSSLSGLLSQWSNTFFPQGHAISACVIQAHTQLYHGRHDSRSPPSPEWLALDVEMAYGIMGNLKDSRMLTYRTTRQIRALYFDGFSGDSIGIGTESQMVFLAGDSEKLRQRPWPGRRPGGRPPAGRPPAGRGKPARGHEPHRPPGGGGPPDFGGGNPLEDEYFRAEGLCNWIKKHGLGGKGWGYEGIVRMNAGFEMIWCDFNSPSLKLLSNLNVSAPRIDMEDERRWPGRPNTDDEVISNTGRAGQVALLGHGNQFNTRHGEQEGPHGPDMSDWSEPFRYASLWIWFTAGARRYGRTAVGPGRGEARVRVDTCGFFTFYDPELQSQGTARVEAERKLLNISLDGQWQAPEDEKKRETALEQLMRRRRPHRIDSVSKQDGAVVQASVERRLKTVLVNGTTACSGIDWQLTAQEVVSFYSWKLASLLKLLNHEPQIGWIDFRDWLASFRDITHWFMMPFFEYPPERPYRNDSLKNNFTFESDRAQGGIMRCGKQYSTEEFQLNDGERLLSWAVEETLDGLCRTVFKVGLSVEYEWLLHFNKASSELESFPSLNLSVLTKRSAWKKSVEELVAWLGWAEHWTGCEGPCAQDELCYIPMWPVNHKMKEGPDRRRRDQEMTQRKDAYRARSFDEHDEADNRPPGGGFGWAGEEYLWRPVCVNASAYPP